MKVLGGALDDGDVAQPGSILTAWPVNWDSNTPVVAGTAILFDAPWASATLLSVAAKCSGGSFTAALMKNGAAIAALNALSVGVSGVTTSAGNGCPLAKGNEVLLVVSGVTGTPTTALVQLNLQTSSN